MDDINALLDSNCSTIYCSNEYTVPDFFRDRKHRED